MAVPANLPEAAPVAVPKTNRNPIGSIRSQPMFIALQGRDLEVPALRAADWLEVLMRPDWTVDDVLVELIPGGLELMLSGQLDITQAEPLVLDLFEEASGRHWWVGLRLISLLVDTWDVMGPQGTFNNVDAEKLSLSAWLDAMLLLLMQRINPEAAPMFVAQLELPPPGIDAAKEIAEQDMEMSESQFLSLAG